MALQSVSEVLEKCSAYFEKRGVPNFKYDAQVLLARALGCRRLDLFLRFDEPLTDKALEPFRAFARRRASREPLQHIIGDVEFFGLKLKCDARALVPRHETEELCETVFERFMKDRPEADFKILDLGTGSGAIALALASKAPNAKVFAVDASADALSLARENAALNALEDRVEFFEGSWFAPLKAGEKFDIVVSNPPYLTQEEFDCAAPEVKNFDPKTALTSPDGGLADLREILSALSCRMKDGAVAAFECGLGQPQILAEEFGANFSAEILPDLSRRDRFLLLKKK